MSCLVLALLIALNIWGAYTADVHEANLHCLVLEYFIGGQAEILPPHFMILTCSELTTLQNLAQANVNHLSEVLVDPVLEQWHFCSCIDSLTVYYMY